MNVVAYTYCDPLLDEGGDRGIWGWEFDRIYWDEGDRDRLDALLADCEAGAVGWLVLRRLEELGDRPREIGDRLARLRDLNVEVVALDGAMAAEPLQQFQQFTDLQKRQHSRRLRRARARERLKALPPPGKAPYGYRRGKDGYLVDRATAPIVKDFFEQFLLYGSLRGAVRYLARRYGKKISPTTGRRWLANPVYRGDLAYGNGEIVADAHPAIVSRQEWAQVDRLLRRNRPLAPRAASAPRSLSGLVACAECGCGLSVSRTTQRHSDKDYLYLRPLNCPRQPKCRALPYGDVLERTIATICRDLSQAVAGLSAAPLDAAKQGIQKAIAAKEAILERLGDLTETGILDVETADLRAYKLRAEIAALRDNLERLPPVNLPTVAQTISIPQFWWDLSEAERRFYLREFVREVRIVRDSHGWTLEVKFMF